VGVRFRECRLAKTSMGAAIAPQQPEIKSQKPEVKGSGFGFRVPVSASACLKIRRECQSISSCEAARGVANSRFQSTSNGFGIAKKFLGAAHIEVSLIEA
jgi:hypothetical protein